MTMHDTNTADPALDTDIAKALGWKLDHVRMWRSETCNLASSRIWMAFPPHPAYRLCMNDYWWPSREVDQALMMVGQLPKYWRWSLCTSTVVGKLDCFEFFAWRLCEGGGDSDVPLVRIIDKTIQRCLCLGFLAAKRIDTARKPT